MSLLVSLQGLASFLFYFVAAVIVQGVFLAIYVAITPHQEFALIRKGNVAAAISLGGAVLGFTLPLANAIIQAASFLDMVVWSAIALVVQLVAFAVIGRLLIDLAQRITDGNVAAATMLASVSLAIGVVNAASMTY
ncbi:MAG: DUF350 domain-containing protein [Alphaproteobacteria bacterium]|nr:DUF350 domain-containing protein [Alphaproteobacteria bacterium]